MKLTPEILKKLILESFDSREDMAYDTPSSITGPARGYYSLSKKDQIKLKIEKGREIKKLFHEYADQRFLRTLQLFHYLPMSQLENFFKDVTSKDELSAIAFKEEEKFKFSPPFGGKTSIALVLGGRVTLLANDMKDITSGKGKAYTDQFPERTKSSGANKGVMTVPDEPTQINHKIYVLDEEDFDPLEYGGHRDNEALVDNWKILAIAVDTPEKKQQVEEMMAKGQIPTHTVVKVGI